MRVLGLKLCLCSQGRTFAKMIQNFVDIYSPLNDTYLPLFATEEGKKVYEETLDAVKKQFPQYLREIQGTADGANVPFSKVRFSQTADSYDSS